MCIMMAVFPHYNCSVRILMDLKEIGTDTKMALFMNKIYYMFIPHFPPTVAFSPLREKCSVCASMLWSQHRFKGGCFPLLISAVPKRETGSHTCRPPHIHCMYWRPTPLLFLSSTSHTIRQVQRASASITFLNKTPCWYKQEAQKSSFPYTPQQSVNALWFPSHGRRGQRQQKRTGLLLHYPPSLIQGKTTLFMWFVRISSSCVRSLVTQFRLPALL